MNGELAELLIRTFNDIRPSDPADAAYLFAQTECNQEASFGAAMRSETLELLLLDTGPRSGYPGSTAWKMELAKSGYNPKRITEVPMENSILLNSRTESQALMHFVKEENFQSLEVIAPPFHQLRAFMTAITIALEENVDIKIYSHPGLPFSWNETVVHSQGTLKAERRQLIHEELARIETYQLKGDLAPTAAVLDYLNQRDA